MFIHSPIQPYMLATYKKFLMLNYLLICIDVRDLLYQPKCVSIVL